MPPVTVRQARAADDLDVVSVKRAAIEADAGATYSADQVAAWSPGNAELEDYGTALEDDRFLILVAELGDAVVGFGVLNVESGALLALYVQPRLRGTGIGSTLLAHIEGSAQMNGAITLDLLAATNAVTFYDDHGYERTGTVEREIDGESLDFVAMAKEL